MNVDTGEVVDGPIDRTRYSPVSWQPGGDAYYYVRRLSADPVPAGEEQFHRRVYYHRVGTDPEYDALVFGDGLDKTNYYGVRVSRDGRWLSISASAGTAPRNDLWLADLASSPADAPQLQPLQHGVDARTGIEVGRDGRLYIFTDRDAPRGRLCVSRPELPTYDTWLDLLPEDRAAVLEGYAILDGRPEEPLGRPVLLAAWTRHAVGEITVHDLVDGSRIGSVDLPGLGSVGGLVERPEGGSQAWFGYTDHTTPSSVYRFDALTRQVDLWASAPGVGGHPRRPHHPDHLPLPRHHARADVRGVAGGVRRASPDHPVRVWRLRRAADPGVRRVHHRLGGGRWHLRRCQPARWIGGGRGVAPGGDARSEAERFR